MLFPQGYSIYLHSLP